MFHSASCAIEVPTVLASVVRAQLVEPSTNAALLMPASLRLATHSKTLFQPCFYIHIEWSSYLTNMAYIYICTMYYFILNNIIGIVPSASVDAWHLFSAKSTTQDALCNNFELSLQLTRSQARFWCRCIGTWKEATLSLVQRMTRQPLGLSLHRSVGYNGYESGIHGIFMGSLHIKWL